MDGHPLYDRDNVAVFPGSYHPGELTPLTFVNDSEKRRGWGRGR